MTFPHNPDPLVRVPFMVDERNKPLGAPMRNPAHRPQFTPEDVRAMGLGCPDPDNDPGAVMRQTQARIEESAQRRAAPDDAAKIAALPSREEQQAREIAALKADVADLRVRLARLEQPARSRTRSRNSDDFPPRAA